MCEDGNITVVFPEPRKVVLEEYPIPQIKRGEVLIKTRRTLISTGTELTILSGEFPPNSVWARLSKFPFIPGYSNIGEIVDVGEDVEKRWIGKKVATYRGGYHAQYIVSTPDNCCIVPEGILDDYATFFALARTAMNGVRKGKVWWGEKVAIYGLGILGQLTARFCHIAGARPIVCIDISDKRLKYLPNLPGIAGINPRKKESIGSIKKLTRNSLFDVVFEVTGNPDIISQELEILKPQGRFVVLSSPRGKTLFDFHDLCNWPSYIIIGAHNSSHPQVETPDDPWTEKRHTELFFDLIANGELDVESLITHRGSYKKAPELYKMLLEDRSQALGVILEW